jgi:hypothetical protein
MAKSTTLQVKNNTGSTLSANKLVYVTGIDATDLITTVAIADSNTESKMPAIGMVREDIANGELGEVRVAGLVSGFDTKGQSPNASVYAGKNGGVTFTSPSSGTSQKIGLVVSAAAAPDGQLFLFPLDIAVKHAGSHELGGNDEIDHDELKGLENDSHKIYSLIDGSRAFTGTIEGITPTQPSHLVTKQYVDGIGQNVTTTLTSESDGYMAFFIDSKNIAGDEDIYWDRLNNCLAIGNGGVGVATSKLFVKTDGSTTQNSLRLDHSGSNFIVRPLTEGGTSTIIENTGGGALVINPTSGNVGIGGAPATSAKLDITSTTGALLVPRMTTSERDALTAVDGMIVYNTTTAAFNKRQAGAWVAF